MKFNLHIIPEDMTYEQIKNLCVRAEKSGFHSLTLADHVYPLFKPVSTPVLETWTLISALAIETRKIKLGTLVLCNAFRHPALLAKMAATLDQISGGRLIFGLGAGWLQSECEAYGIPFEAPSERIDRLDEALTLIKKLWTEEASSYDGNHFNLSKAYCSPKPKQKPYPPILIGGIGKKILRVVSKHADYVDFVGLTPAQYKEKKAEVQEYLKETSRKDLNLTFSMLTATFIASDKSRIRREAERYKTVYPKEEIRQLQLDDFMGQNLFLTAEECISRIEEYQKAGVQILSIIPIDLPYTETLEFYEEKIIPYFKASA